MVIFIFCGVLSADSYRIYLFGIPIVSVSMEDSGQALSLHTKTIGMIHAIWSVDNHYYTEYNSTSFGIQKYTKSINQGKYSGKLDCYYDPVSSMLYYNNRALSVVDSIQNIFTILARVSVQSLNDLDTKWFPMNHEGQPHRARFLWAAKDKVEINDVEILCDHYRLDIEKEEGESIQVSPWDYFTDHIASDEALRQIWVEQNGKRRIIKASVSIYGMTITAEIQE